MINSDQDNLAVWGQFLWTERFGYLRIQDIVGGGAILYVLLTGIVTVLTSDLITLAFLVIVAVLVLKFAQIERHVPPERRVTVYTSGGLFIAEHPHSGRTRHGVTPQEALTNLGSAV